MIDDCYADEGRDAQALAAARPRPRHAHPQAHVPRHDRAAARRACAEPRDISAAQATTRPRAAAAAPPRPQRRRAPQGRGRARPRSRTDGDGRAEAARRGEAEPPRRRGAPRPKADAQAARRRPRPPRPPPRPRRRRRRPTAAAPKAPRKKPAAKPTEPADAGRGRCGRDDRRRRRTRNGPEDPSRAASASGSSTTGSPTGSPRRSSARTCIEDVRIRDHIRGKLSHAGLSDIHIRKDKQRITIDIYTARPGIVIGKSGSEVDALRQDVHAMTAQGRAVNINEIKRPELDAKLVAQSVAEQLQNRVSFRRAMKRSLASAIRSGAQGVQDPVRRPPRRRRDVAHRAVLGGPRPAAHAARGHRLRLRRGADHVRPHRRQGLDQQGRDHARGLRGRPAADDAPRRGRRAPPRAASRR